jgi:hypothetical protein
MQESLNLSRLIANESAKLQFEFEVDDLFNFKICLESVKFPRPHPNKGQFNDVLI